MAFLHQALGDEQTATSWMQQAENMARTAPRVQVIAQVSLYKVRLQLAQGQLITAQQWARESGPDISQVPDYSAEMAYLILVRIFLDQADPALLPPIIKVTTHLLKRAEAQHRWGRAIEILSLQALAYQAFGQTERALKSLENALSVAEPEGYIRRFVDEGQPIAALLQLATNRKFSPGYTSCLLAACKAEQVRLTTQSKAQPLVEPLTDRELEVLHLIAAGLSNKAIAETLFITIGTVKRHTMNIYGKLGVNSRTQATVKARELNLIV